MFFRHFICYTKIVQVNTETGVTVSCYFNNHFNVKRMKYNEEHMFA